MIRAYRAGLRIVEIPALHERCTVKVSSVRLWRDTWLQFTKLRQFSRAISNNDSAAARGEIGLRRALRFVWTRWSAVQVERRHQERIAAKAAHDQKSYEFV